MILYDSLYLLCYLASLFLGGPETKMKNHWEGQLQLPSICGGPNSELQVQIARSYPTFADSSNVQIAELGTPCVAARPKSAPRTQNSNLS